MKKVSLLCLLVLVVFPVRLLPRSARRQNFQTNPFK